MPHFAQQYSSVAKRFQRDTDWYVAIDDGAIRTFQIHANSERVVELFYRLSSFLEPVVDMVIDDRRHQRVWEGSLRFLPDVREALGRLRWPLAAFGGVEMSLYTANDQLTLTSPLTLVIYSRGDQWPVRLAAEGIVSKKQAPPPVWQPSAVPFSDAAELDAALILTAERLALESKP